MNPQRLLRWLTILAILAGWAAWVRLAAADVRDPTGTFSASAIQQADATIRQINQAYHKDMTVEVFPSIPSNLQSGYNPQQKAPFFREWALSRARDLRINGVYVLICREPSHLEAAVGNQTQQRAFTLRDRDQLAAIMLRDLNNHQWDQALLDGTRFVKDTMQRNLGAMAARPQSSSATSGFSWWWVILIVVGIILFISLIGRLIGGGSSYAGGGYGPRPPAGGPGPYGGGPGPYGGYGGGGGGGGMGRGLLGGLLGGAAGGWLYNHFFGSSQPGGFPAGQASPPPADLSQPDTDYSASGGDFGTPPNIEADDSGGGDIGGGGDFGGGDSGGGGGDSGGGGDFA